jgi:hypothetical protein
MLLEENILKHAQTRKGEKERERERESLAQLAAKVTV